MIIFFIILLLVTILGLRKSDCKEKDYMSIKMTNSIKGFFLCMVFFSHIWGYTEFNNLYLDNPYQIIRRITGQCIVAMFLFYSGYGVMESIKEKEGYIKRIPVQRFLRVLLQFDFAVLLFWVYRYLTGTHYSIKKMVLTFVGWDGIGNSNWYIFCILWVYIFTYFSFKSFKSSSNTKAVIGIALLSLIYMAIICKLGKEYWWYDTILCYSWGMFFSLYRKNIEDFVNENLNTWIFFFAIFVIGFIATYLFRNTNFFVYQVWVFCFISAIVTFTMRFVIDSRPLQWLGKNLFEVYILQRLAMLILKPYMLKGEVTSEIKYLYVLVCFIVTILISISYRETIGKIINRLISKL